jgi:hypothetical protein
MRTPTQRFEYREIERAAITPAPYNPRTMSADAEQRLRANLARVGLLTTLVWNERTGHLVGGHQRLRLLDELEGGTAYRLGVAVIDVDDARERELNVFLNNTWAQGEFNADALLALIAEAGGEESVITAMGFTAPELLLEYGARDELQAVLPDAKSKAPRKTSQDTLGPHVLLVFRTNADKEQYLRHLGRPDDTKRMGADEIRDYLTPDARWR